MKNTNLYGKAAEVANEIVNAFQEPNSLPKPLAQIFIHIKDGIPCHSWSWRNRLIAALHGTTDARGFRQWEQVGRKVKKGQKAFYILAPLAKTKVDEDTGEEKRILYGFKGTPVFALEQTEGEPLPEPAPGADSWIQNLPLFDVAKDWGLTVQTYQGRFGGPLGAFNRSGVIGLGVKNLSTWVHELVHAADFRNGKLKECGQHWRSETVAELGGAVLLQILGYENESDLGGCWEYLNSYATKAHVEVVEACNLMLERTCEALALILDTAERLKHDDSHEDLSSEYALQAS